ncbi:serine-rich adhesin for platelets isoform X2 [Drosophila yakuba]|uniref:serine-rich adhesin for platelets isoform X2 n=1 Tax=Drosophila yakuba TaxID=7245 RepID=UPI0019308A51|nr:serine-rich adhesin for platelets isoform X2 [Drosophila yakuba]
MYFSFVQILLLCVFIKIIKASLSENDTRNLYTHEQHKKDSFSNPYYNERYYISNHGNKKKYISPNRHKSMFIHHREPFGYDKQDPRVFKNRYYFIQKRYPSDKDPRNLQGHPPQRLTSLQEFPVPLSNEDLDDIKYPSQLESSHDSPIYNNIFHPERYASYKGVYKQDGESQGIQNINSENNVQDFKTQFQNYRAPQTQNVHSFQDPDKPESYFNKQELKIMKNLYKGLQLQYRSRSRQDKAGPKNIREKASKLILQWAENQRNLLNSIVNAITEVLKDSDYSLHTERNIPPRDIMLLKNMLLQLFKSITQLKEDSTSTRIRTVLSQWIETQKSLIDSFFQAIQITNQNVDNSASVNAVMENLIKNLRELIILLSDKTNVTATEISSFQPTTITYATTTFYLTSITSETTHPTVNESTNRIIIIEHFIKGLRQMLFQIIDKEKYSSTTYNRTYSTNTHPNTTYYSTAEGTTSHSTTNTYEVRNLIIDKMDSKIKDMFRLIKGLEVLISQLNKKPSDKRTTNLPKEITIFQTTTTTTTTMTTCSQSTPFNLATTESTPSYPTTNDYQVTNQNFCYKFKILENWIKELNGLINQLCGKKNIISTTHSTGDSNSSHPNDRTHSLTERSFPPVTADSYKSTSSTTTSQSTTSNHSPTESTSFLLSTTHSKTENTTYLTASTYDFKDQQNYAETKILKNLISRLLDLIDFLNNKNDIKSTPHLTTKSSFYNSVNNTPTQTTTNVPPTFSKTESMAIDSNYTQITDTSQFAAENISSHFTTTTKALIMITDSQSTISYPSTTESSSSQFNDGENINRSTKFTAESSSIIFNNPTTMTNNNQPTTGNTASHVQPSTTPSTTESSTTTKTLSSYKDEIKSIVEHLKILRKILKTVADKSDGKLSPQLLSRVREVLKQIVAGHIDSGNGDSAELEILLFTTVKPSEYITELTMEKLLKLFDDFERMYNVLLDGSIQNTTQFTTQNTIFSTKHNTLISTTQSPKTTSPTQNTAATLTTPTANNSATSRSSTPSLITNLGSDVSNNLQPIVDAIQQLKMALYHDFYAFKKSQEERMEQIHKLLNGKLLNRRTKTIAKPKTIRIKGIREIHQRNGEIKEVKMHHNAVKLKKMWKKENPTHMKGIPKWIFNSASPRIKMVPHKLSAINVIGGSKHLLSKRKTTKKVLAIHDSFPKPLSIWPHKQRNIF